MFHVSSPFAIRFVVPVIFTLCISCISFGAEEPGKFEITANAKQRQVSVKAENAGLRDVLAELAVKTGMHVEVLAGVPDRKVSVDMQDVPYFGISTLLEKMGIKNYGVGMNGKPAGNTLRC